jgi:hypothetical protein
MEPPPTVEALLNKLMVEQDVEIPVERVKNRESVYKICNRVPGLLPRSFHSSFMIWALPPRLHTRYATRCRS